MKTNIFSIELDFDKFEKFLELFEDAVIISNQKGDILLVNSKVEKVFQYTEEEILNLKIEDLIPSRKRAGHVSHRKHYQKNPIPREMDQRLDIRGLRKDGKEIPLKISLNSIESKKGLLIASEIRDISADYEVQNKLIHSEQYATSILEGVAARIVVLDKNGVVEAVNRAWEEFIEENKENLSIHINVGDNLKEITLDENNPYNHFAKRIGIGIERVSSGKMNIFTTEYPITLGENQKWFLLQISPMKTEQGGTILTFFDITKQKKAQKDLIDSYETTLEGWSRAMDLRDKETEGHTQRVTEMTVKIAKKMGVPEHEIVHIRRGALLHDMGKLGIPDNILFKPGKLDEEEWEIMKQHPVFAYDMLYPIEFLRLSIDIPYCHHERWDGTGYPRGLKGEEIPLAARIFAVVDVWDALRSDRPYRDGWPEEKVIQYIKDNAGTHFQPQIVDIFIKVLEEENKANRRPIVA